MALESTPVILIEGAALDLGIAVLAIDLIQEVNRIPRARITFSEAFDPAEQTWSLAERGLIAAGRTIEVGVRDAEGTETSLFRGRVLRVSLEAGPGEARLTAEAAGGAHRLTQGRRNAVFENTTDEDAIRKIVEAAGLGVGDLTAPPRAPTHEALVQHDCSDWDFILARADALGVLVLAEGDTVSLGPMAASGAAAATLEIGRDGVLDLALELDAGGQHPALEAFAWDLGGQQRTPAVTASEPGAAQGKDVPADLGEALSLPDWRLAHLAPLPADELQAWADARLARRRLAMIRGRLTLPGAVGIGPLDVVELKGAGEAFDGKALVTGVRHRVLPGSWRSDLQLGLAPASFAETPGIREAPAAGLLPGVRGLQIGVVAAYEDDPLGEYRVRLTLPGLGEGGDGTLWARLAAPEAGAKRGYVFRPRAGDEVVVGFLNEDPRQPVILGALFGSKNAPGGDFATPSEENLHKGIATASGAGLAFRDDDNPATILCTPRGTITIDDDAKTIEVKDVDGNKVLLEADGITIKSAKDLTIKATGKVIIAGSEVEIA